MILQACRGVSVKLPRVCLGIAGSGTLDKSKLSMYTKQSPYSRGVSGALNLQSAIAGVMFCLGCFLVELPLVSGVDVLVSRNGNL